MTDILRKFIFEDANARGEFAQLSQTWQETLARNSYPQAVQNILGEMMAATALLSATLKFNGALIMQIHGDGPLQLLVVECNADLKMRATAKVDENADIAKTAKFGNLVNKNGKGRFIITLVPKEKSGEQIYQGIIPLDGDNVSEVIQNYMLHSEQLDTHLWLSSDDKNAKGILLQKMPSNGFSEENEDAENWNRIVMLAKTITPEEMKNVDADTLIQRLFWEETVRIFDAIPISFSCSCSREKVVNMLKMLGKDEVENTLKEQKNINVNCNFCGKKYQFDSIDCQQLFKEGEFVREYGASLH